MAYDFLLPDLGEGIAEAEVRRWLVKVGERVEEHQNVVELETDKAVIEVPTPRAGTVLALLRGEGETLQVGEALLSIADEGGPLPTGRAVPSERAVPAAAGGATKAPAAAVTAPAVGDEPQPQSLSVVGQLPEAEEEPPRDEVLATPAARALARERGVDIGRLRGTGHRGSVTREDVLAAAERRGDGRDGYGPVERLPLSATRRAIVKRLGAAHDAAVYVTAMSEVDATELWELRARKDLELSARGIRLTFIPFILKALALSLKRHPALNAELDEETSSLVLKKYVNVGIAVDGPEGLLVPVLRDVQDKTILELAGELGELADLARRRQVAPAQLRGGSFALSNFGSFGGVFATPVPNYPDVAILGCGAIADRPWVVEGALAIRKILPLSLTFDHRVCDGGDAARFLAELGEYLNDPGSLLIESR